MTSYLKQRISFQFSLLISLTGLTLVVGMLAASRWQWHRHLEKQHYIAGLQARLEAPPQLLGELIADPATLQDPEPLLNRQAYVEGEYDFGHEMILRNRRSGELAGVHVLTPLKVTSKNSALSGTFLLVDRGFIPLHVSDRELRKPFQHEPLVKVRGVLKLSTPRRWLAPADPPAGPPNPWVDGWLRTDLGEMAKQLPYTLLPVYLEIIPEGEDPLAIQKKMIKTESGETELLLLGLRKLPTLGQRDFNPADFPIPTFSTVIPAARHLGYVFEWAAMALATLLITTVVQIRRVREGEGGFTPLLVDTTHKRTKVSS